MSNDHRIERISVISRAEDMAAARAHQSRVVRLVRGPIARAWSKVMDRYAGAEETVHLDRLELRVTDWSDGLSEHEVEQRLVTALEGQLDQHFGTGTPPAEGPTVQRTAAWRAQRWADFLVTGRWYDTTGRTSPQAFFAAAVGEQSRELLPAWRAAYQRAGNRAWDRLWRQMPTDRLAEWLAWQWSEKVPAAAFTRNYWRTKQQPKEVAEQLFGTWLCTVAGTLARQESMVVWPVRFWKALLAQWPTDRQLPILPKTNDWSKDWRATARQYEGRMPGDLASSRDEHLTEAPLNRPATTEPNSEGEYFVTGAGLVLLHPYLPLFFQELGLLDAEGKAFVDPPARERALQLCHWLVTGEQACAEQQITLYKLLCAWPEGVVPRTDHILPDAWLAAGDRLLRAVIRNWDKLGDISPEALRESFLQREGKIGADGMGDHLRVEQRGMDILLEYLPWGIGIIKLPWMPKLLRVEWT